MAGLWDYIKTLFGEKVDELKDPEIEIEQAIQGAERRDQELRSQAAKVIAHRTRVAEELEDSAEELAKARELAKQALLKADEAKRGGNEEEALRWMRSARALAMRIQAAQSNYDRLQSQVGIATEQAEKAKAAVLDNAMELQEISSKRMQMLGELETAKMQEAVNRTMSSISSRMAEEGPSLKEVEDKIQQRMAEAQARAELDAATPEGSMAELERQVDLAEADTVLLQLRSELGLAGGTDAGSLPAAKPSSTLPPVHD
jgi:phage shock protein A